MHTKKKAIYLNDINMYIYIFINNNVVFLIFLLDIIQGHANIKP